VEITATATPTAAASTPAPEPSYVNVPGIYGNANVNGVALAGAEIKVYRLGKSQQVGGAKTNPDGTYALALDAGVPEGSPLKIIATQAGKTLATIGPAGIVATGGGNIVATGGGNLVATGGGNIVATGGGNFISGNGASIVATGGGNLVASGGGNVVAQGAGNRRLMEVPNPPGSRNLTLASTVTYQLFAPRLEACGDATTLEDGRPITEQVNAMIQTFDRFTTSTQNTVSGFDPTTVNLIVGFLTANGTPSGTPPGQVTDALARDPQVLTAFTEAGNNLGSTIERGVNAGGARPPQSGLTGLSLGTASTGIVTVPDNPRDTSPQTGSSGSSGGGGSNGATEILPETGMIGIDAILNEPTFSPSPQNPQI
jgi:hypothetical protein